MCVSFSQTISALCISHFLVESNLSCLKNSQRIRSLLSWAWTYSPSVPLFWIHLLYGWLFSLFLFLSLSISLSLTLYIYIYIYIYFQHLIVSCHIYVSFYIVLMASFKVAINRNPVSLFIFPLRSHIPDMSCAVSFMGHFSVFLPISTFLWLRWSQSFSLDLQSA